MKKLILPLLLLLGITMLVAVESQASAVVGYVKYQCASGLNFIGMPLNANIATTDDLSALYPTITSIQKWDGTFWTAVNYEDGLGWDGTFDLDNKSVLFIYTTAPVDIYSLGGLPSPLPQFVLNLGLNTIYIPLNKSSITDSDLLAADLPGLTSIQQWDGTFWTAVNYEDGLGWDGTITGLTIGKPLFVYKSTGAGPWTSGMFGQPSNPKMSKY